MLVAASKLMKNTSEEAYAKGHARTFAGDGTGGPAGTLQAGADAGVVVEVGAFKMGFVFSLELVFEALLLVSLSSGI